MQEKELDFKVSRLGEWRIISPMSTEHYVDDKDHVLYLGDVGLFLRDKIIAHFKELKVELNLKYIDPSYTIRSVSANAHDSAFCLLLGHNAVHAGMAGRTNMVVGDWNGDFTHVPIPMAVHRRKKIDPDGRLWNTVLASTGQPRVM
jgi:6-phosphofructokinase 1